MVRDDRAVNQVLNYTLLIGILVVFSGGMAVTMNNYISGQEAQVVDSQLDTTGQHIASDIEGMDRLVRAGSNPTVSMTIDVQEEAGDTRYRVSIDHLSGDRYELVLDAVGLDVDVTVHFTSEVNVETVDGIDGGSLELTWSGSEIEVGAT